MKKLNLLLVLFCLGCAHKTDNIPVSIALTDSNRSLKITGFDKAIVDDIGRDTSDVWQSLLPVYKMPADTDMKDFQNAQPGRYTIKDSSVMFTPDTPFAKGKTYFVRCYNFGGTKNAWEYVRQKKGTGGSNHKDLLFKY